MSSLPPLKKKPEQKSKKINSEYEINIEEYAMITDQSTDISPNLYIVQNKKTGKKYTSETYQIQINNQNEQFISHDCNILIQTQDQTINQYRGFSVKDLKGENNFTTLMDYTSNVSLSTILSKKKLPSNFDNTIKQIILVGIAHGMMILHDRHIIHGNLKQESILLDKSYNPIITNIGFSNFYNTKNLINKLLSNCSICSYVAPEFISNAVLTTKSDVYAFGILMYEIITGKRAYCQLIAKKKITPSSLIGKVQKGLRPTFDQPIKEGLKELIEKCWSQKVEDRPTFSEIFSILSLSQKESEESKYCLDDVNLNELFAYIKKISNKPVKRIEKVDEKPPENKGQDTQLMKNYSKLKKENEEMKIRISKLEKQLFKVATIEIFNTFPLKTQQALVSDIVSKNGDKANPLFIKLNKLLLYLLQFKHNENDSYVLIVSKEDDKLLAKMVKEEGQIFICSAAIEMLKKEFKSKEFNDILKEFNDVLIELKYPSENFKQTYQFFNTKKSVKIGIFIDGVERTDDHFHDNDKISSIRFGSEVKSIQGSPFSELGAFKGCTSLSRVDFSSSVNHVERRSFKDCFSLFEIKISSSLNSISPYCFSCCKSLKIVSIPSSVTLIGDSAFECCTSLSKIEIPKSVIKIGCNVFNGCSSLTKIEIPNSVISIGESTFSNCSSLKIVKISSSLKSVDNFTFDSCSSLSAISLPASVTEIGFRAFRGCSSLKDVKLPSGLTFIGDCAFEGCSLLEKIKVPSSVSYTGKDAFPEKTKIVDQK